VNARAHRLGGMEKESNNTKQVQSWIRNQEFLKTYKRFLVYLVLKKSLSVHDRLMLVTYLLMQERIKESIEEFKKIDPSF